VRTTKRRNGSPLANRDYLLFLMGAFVSSLGSWMQSVALSWTALQLGHGSSFILGLLGFVSTAPVLVLGVAAGSLADRADRRRVLLVTQSAALILAAILTVLQAAGRNTVASLLIIAGANGVVNALNGPSWQAFIKELVGPKQLRRAVAINSARFNLTRIFGPAVGGWLLVASGAAACFGVNTLSFLAVIVALLMIRTHSAPVGGSRRGGLAATLEIGRNPQIRAVLLPAIGLTVLALPYGSFLPKMAADVFHQGAGGLSVLLTATGVGALLGAFVSGLRVVARSPQRWLAGLQVATGVALAGFAWSPSIYTGVPCLILFGAALIGYLAIAGATIQLAAEPGTEGRALGLWMIVNSGLVPIGSLLIGVAADIPAISIRGALGAAGVGCLLFGILAVFGGRRMTRDDGNERRVIVS
jgi:MFS family permease